MKKTNRYRRLSPEVEQKPCPVEGLEILARMISRAYLAKHIAVEPQGNGAEIDKPVQRLTGSREKIFLPVVHKGVRTANEDIP